jgi:hypothetical protein
MTPVKLARSSIGVKAEAPGTTPDAATNTAVVTMAAWWKLVMVMALCTVVGLAVGERLRTRVTFGMVG